MASTDSTDPGLYLNSCEKSVTKCNIEGILYFGLIEDGVEDSSLAETTFSVTKKFLQFLQAVLRMNYHLFPRIYLVTRGQKCVENSLLPPIFTPLAGMFRTFKNENTSCTCKTIDLDPSSHNSKLDALQIGSELWTTIDPFVSYRQGIRYVARLDSVEFAQEQLSMPTNGTGFKLSLPASKSIIDLKFVSVGKYLQLGEFDVEVQVKASALNFHDILSILKPTNVFSNCNSIADDFSGIVAAVGSKVQKLSVGEKVLGSNLNKNESLPSRVVINENYLVRLPLEMTFAEGATFPTAFNTVYHSLITIAKLQERQRILIHTASGGVGLYAIQIARMMDVEIFATAGNERKRNFLRRMGLEHVYSSRDLKFGEEILKITEGKGVDVVLNSLTGPGFKETTLLCCGKNSYFIEMSKLHIWNDEEVSLLRPDVQYSAVDISTVDEKRSLYLINELQKLLDGRKIRPIPYTSFHVTEVRTAILYLKDARAIGKVVLIHPTEVQKDVLPHFNDRSTYMVTGGTKGIGLEVLKWMCTHGAKHVVIVGRNSPNGDALEQINQMKNAGNQVVFMKGDVGELQTCQEILNYIRKELPPLRGIMHAAGVISDFTIQNQTPETFALTFKAKVHGTWNLHQLTTNLTLEYFVLFSTFASIYGSSGQSNHVAANAFMDGFAQYRHSLGLPVTSVNWGLWGETGIARGKTLRFVAASPMSTAGCLHALENALLLHKVQVSALPQNVISILRQESPWTNSYFEHLVYKSEVENYIHNNTSVQIWTQLENEKDNKNRTDILKNIVKQAISSILKLGPHETFVPNQQFRNMGMDSLMMIELRNKLQIIVAPNITLGVHDLVSATTVEEVATRMLQLITNNADNVGSNRDNRTVLVTEKPTPSQHIVTSTNENGLGIRDVLLDWTEVNFSV